MSKSAKERQDAWRARGGAEADVIFLSVPVHRWGLSDFLIQHHFLQAARPG
jgi:hypothetical protein